MDKSTELQSDIIAQWIFFVSLHLNNQSHAINKFNEYCAQRISQGIDYVRDTAKNVNIQNIGRTSATL
jgi:poly(3-hydroxyalkanoate) synthetase